MFLAGNVGNQMMLTVVAMASLSNLPFPAAGADLSRHTDVALG